MKLTIAILGAALACSALTSPAFAVTLKEKGETTTNGACGGFLGLVCPEKQWCDYPAEAKCGMADQFGTCRLSPEICTKEFMPVCACNGETYSNACQAAAAGFDVAHAGACTK